MDFLYMNSREPAVELDVQKEIVSGDAFFGKAKEYVTGDRETLLYRQEFFRDVLQINELPEFLAALHAKLNEISPLMGEVRERQDARRSCAICFTRLFISSLWSSFADIWSRSPTD